MYDAICHLTIPSFYVQIHTLFFPEHRNMVFVIGGSPKDYGIVMEASPAAKRKGIRPGMLSSRAREIAPETLFFAPDRKNYDYFIKKITGLMENYSLKWAGDSYHSFFLFLPDYFDLISTLKQIQYDIHHKWELNTKAGLSDNKYIARLAGQVTVNNEILHVDKNNAERVFGRSSITHIAELTKPDIEKLNLAGIYNIQQLFKLDLFHLRFFLNDKGEHLYYNYICQVKTVRDRHNINYEEIIFYNTTNNMKTIIETSKRRTASIIHGLQKKKVGTVVNRVKVYIEYIDDKNYMTTGKVSGRNNIKASVKAITAILSKFTRRVRIKKIGIYFFHTSKGAEYLWPLKKELINTPPLF